MILEREGAKGVFDRLFIGVSCNAEYLVIIALGRGEHRAPILR